MTDDISDIKYYTTRYVFCYGLSRRVHQTFWEFFNHNGKISEVLAEYILE